MSNIAQQRKTAIGRMVDGEGHASPHDRRAAFHNRDVPEQLRALVDKVAKHAYKVTDGDIAAAKAAGYTEDQIFELVVCAAIGQANRQYDNALAALKAATKE
jgi:alkylhydroperoxidase family enzyme